MIFYYQNRTCALQTLFKGNSSLCHVLSLILRTGNTFLGSLMWVDFVRLIGLQPKSEEPDCVKKK
jgi:hypothetical protein